jgi:hypothetical protein
MTTSNLRGGLLGLALALGSGTGTWLAVSQARHVQTEQLEALSTELASLRRDAPSRPCPLLPVAAAAPAAVTPRLTPEEVDAIAVRLAALLEQPGAASDAPHTPRAPAALTPVQHEAMARASEQVERVLASGRMTPEDVREIRRELAVLGGREETETLRRRLMVAINQDRLSAPPGPDAIP